MGNVGKSLQYYSAEDVNLLAETQTGRGYSSVCSLCFPLNSGHVFGESVE